VRFSEAPKQPSSSLKIALARNWVLRRSLRIVPWPGEFSSSIVGAGHLVLKLNVQFIARAPARRMQSRLQICW